MREIKYKIKKSSVLFDLLINGVKEKGFHVRGRSVIEDTGSTQATFGGKNQFMQRTAFHSVKEDEFQPFFPYYIKVEKMSLHLVKDSCYKTFFLCYVSDLCYIVVVISLSFWSQTLELPFDIFNLNRYTNSYNI